MSTKHSTSASDLVHVRNVSPDLFDRLGISRSLLCNSLLRYPGLFLRNSHLLQPRLDKGTLNFLF
eukprot:SAG31_NODE_1573_length_7850_cov_1.757193_11_plen_65_part_00